MQDSGIPSKITSDSQSHQQDSESCQTQGCNLTKPYNHLVYANDLITHIIIQLAGLVMDKNCSNA